MALVPFELVFETGSPVILNQYPLHFDGLLSNICYKHTGCPQEGIEMLRELLLWNEEHGLYHASAMAFGVNSTQGVIASHRHYVGSMKTGKQLRDDLISPTALNKNGDGSYRKLIVAGGPERNRLRKYAAYHSPYLVFHGVGDIRSVEPLIRFYCSRLGVNANSGAGTVRSFSIREIEHDYSFFDETGELARNVPIQMYKEMSSTHHEVKTLPITAPYWRGHINYSEVQAVQVGKVRRVLIAN